MTKIARQDAIIAKIARQDAIIVDLDGTLCDDAHRQHLVPDWDDYHSQCKNDWLHEDIHSLIHAMRINHCVILLTGRTEKFKDMTKDWLKRHGVVWHSLFMRPDNNREPNAFYKQGVYEEHIEPNYNVTFALDDNKSVIEMWRRLGITALHCDDTEY